MVFNHEKLNVYQRMLSFNAQVVIWTGEWDRKHAIRDQFSRAAGSILENIAIAEGNGRFSNADQARFLGTSHESAIKLAARLDLCVTQHFLPQDEVIEWKALLKRVSDMTSAMIAGVQQ